MKKRGLSSPDVADALAMTYAFPVTDTKYSGKITRVDKSDSGLKTMNKWRRRKK